MSRHLTPADLAAIAKRTMEGETAASVASRLGVSLAQVNTARSMLRVTGALPARNYRSASDPEVMAAVARYASGEDAVAIARDYGVSSACVRAWAMRVGVKRPKRELADVVRERKAKANGLRDWALARAREGWVVASIARVVGLSRERVRQWVEAEGSYSIPQNGKHMHPAALTVCPHCQADITVAGLAALLPRETSA